MRISTKGRHAVMAMIDLERNSGGKPIALTGVAYRQQISLSYLEQLVARLKSHGLLKSHRGPGGGYTLARPGDSITVNDIVEAVDDAISRSRIKDPAAATNRELADILWQAVSDEVSDYLKKVTLSSVASGVLCEKRDESKTAESDLLSACSEYRDQAMQVTELLHRSTTQGF